MIHLSPGGGQGPIGSVLTPNEAETDRSRVPADAILAAANPGNRVGRGIVRHCEPLPPTASTAVGVESLSEDYVEHLKPTLPGGGRTG